MIDLFLILIVFVGFIGVLVYKDKKYKQTAYYLITKNPYQSIKYDKGKYGEYLIYERLKRFEANGGKFLFNLYIPKPNNGTTEIDLILICPKGLLVFESKNYGGWIFGNEANKDWTQTFPKGRGRSHKERFYNPIRQNATHLKHLKRLIGENFPVRSIIVFSDECTLKDVTVRSSNVIVVNRYNVLSAVTQIYDQTQDDVLTPSEIDDLYGRLHPYTQVSFEKVEEHISNIKNF
jgi:hypothetical protein